MVTFEDPDQPPEPSQVTCPYCGDYAGKPDSVRGHIRAKTDDQHKGKSGFEDGTDQAMQGVEQPPEPEPATEPATEASAEQAPDQGASPDSGGVAGLVLVGLVAVVIWLARQTGNEDRIENQFGQDRFSQQKPR